MDWTAMSLIPNRYEIYLAELSPTVGAEISKTRPVVVVSQNEMNRNLETIVICPITSKLHPQWQSRLQIICAGAKAEIAVDQIRTISKSRLKKKLDKLSAIHAAQLRRLITEMYGEA
jgi:mRNA interferase MazF